MTRNTDKPDARNNILKAFDQKTTKDQKDGKMNNVKQINPSTAKLQALA